MANLTTGELARRAGVNLQTILYYERRGLLEPAQRTAANYRAFSSEAVERVRFIKRAQSLGFTLKEIEELLALRASPRAGCDDVLLRARRHLQGVEERIRALKGIRRALEELMKECDGQLPASECPILRALERKEQK